MGHQDKVKKLGRTKPHKEAMLANMAMSLVLHRRIRTTEAKAKALRPIMDRLIMTAKKDNLASKRQVAKTLHVKEVFKKFYDEILPDCDDRDSGFTRIMKLGVRKGDGAPVSIIEFTFGKSVLAEEKKRKEEKEKAKKKAGSGMSRGPL